MGIRVDSRLRRPVATQLELPLDMEACAECEGTGDCGHCGAWGMVMSWGGPTDCLWCEAGRCSWCDGAGYLGWERFVERPQP